MKLNNHCLFSSFADCDMMMRYSGIGVGHHQHLDFPREDGQLKQAPVGEFYLNVQEEETLETIDEPGIDTDDELEGDFEDIAWCQAGDGFEEDMYEL
jgi:hypothetical protein